METILETIQRSSSISFPGLFGDWTIDPPACFTLFGRCVYFYGVIIALGFILGITYCAKNAKRFGIREDDVYGGYRVALTARFETILTPMTIDVSTGDVITPHAVQHGQF